MSERRYYLLEKQPDPRGRPNSYVIKCHPDLNHNVVSWSIGDIPNRRVTGSGLALVAFDGVQADWDQLNRQPNTRDLGGSIGPIASLIRGGGDAQMQGLQRQLEQNREYKQARFPHRIQAGDYADALVEAYHPRKAFNDNPSLNNKREMLEWWAANPMPQMNRNERLAYFVHYWGLSDVERNIMMSLLGLFYNTIVFTADFTGTNGDSWNTAQSGWDVHPNWNDLLWIILSNEGRQGSGATLENLWGFIARSSLSNIDTEGFCSAKNGVAENDWGITARVHDTDGEGNNFYHSNWEAPGEDPELWWSDTSTPTFARLVNASSSIGGGEPVYMRFRSEDAGGGGVQNRIRVWDPGSTSEPGTWDIDNTHNVAGDYEGVAGHNGAGGSKLTDETRYSLYEDDLMTFDDLVVAGGGPKNPLGQPVRGPFGGPIG